MAWDKSPGTGAGQYPCGSFADQDRILEDSGLNFWQFRNECTRLRLAVQSRSIEQQVVVAPCFTEGDTRTYWG